VTGSSQGDVRPPSARGGRSMTEDEVQFRETVARFLLQRSELGQGPLVLESLSTERVLEILGGPLLGHPQSRDDLATGRTGETEGSVAPTPTVMDTPGPGGETGSSDAFEPPEEYDELRATALQCTRCRLADGRTQVVFSDGHPDASVMVVGEAPGANEDRTGLPFVGRAGKLLDLILASVDLSRARNVYICNVLKCRPPGNRNPRPDEIETCSPWLRRQIELVRPRAILAVGTFSGRLLSGRDVALGKLRGQVYTYQGIPLVVTYHPAALLRNPRWVRPTWDDVQLLRGILDRS